MQADSDLFDAQTQFFLVNQYAASINPGGVRQSIVLQDVKGRAQITVILELFNDHPVLRYSLKYKNLTQAATHITWINMVPWTFDDLGKRYTAFRVNQWSVVSKPEDFQPLQNLLDTSGAGIQVYSGSDGQQCGWLALRDSDQRGLFTGWEFDGRTKTTVRQDGSKGLRAVQFDRARSEPPRAIPKRVPGALRLHRPVSRRLGRGGLPHAAFRGIRAGQTRAGLQDVPLCVVGLLGLSG